MSKKILTQYSLSHRSRQPPWVFFLQVCLFVLFSGHLDLFADEVTAVEDTVTTPQALKLEDFNREPPSLLYEGWHMKGLGGATVNIFSNQNPRQWLSPPVFSPLLVLGVDRSWVWKQHIYFGVEANFMAYPLLFEQQETTFTLIGRQPSWVGLLIPNLHFHFGYVFNNNILVTAGFFHLWGLVGTVQVPLSKSFSAEFRYLWFYDRVLFDAGLHDMHGTVGLGYKF